MIEENLVPDDDGARAGTAAGPVETTGRFVVVFAEDGEAGRVAALRATGLQNVASSTDFAAQALDADQAQDADAVYFAELGVAVVAGDPARLSTLRSAGDGVVAVEPELVFRVLSPQSPDYLRGYRDGVSDLCDRLAPGDTAAPSGPAVQAVEDTDQLTWGLQATRAATSPWTGRGVKVAVLDTGMDVDHPDFTGRAVTTQSFVAGEAVQDGHGHGTHCIGTACGPRSPLGVRRYGVAVEADIFAGKVLGNDGSGSDTGILAGINWAIANGCQVVSMSLGADVPQVSRRYQRVGQRALAAGTLIVAAAGNNADRRAGNPGFVGVPANSPSILAVAAVDAELAIANFSARSNPVPGGQVDIAGPGVRVFSSWPMPRRYNTISGTSMATPHVAGIAALYCQATGRTGAQIWATLTQEAQRLPLPSVDVGTGLVQAPR